MTVPISTGSRTVRWVWSRFRPVRTSTITRRSPISRIRIFRPGLDRISDYRLVEQNWRHEFQGYHRDGLCWTTIFHPKVVAKPGRLSILEGLFRDIRKQENVWIAHCAEIADWWIAQNKEKKT